MNKKRLERFNVFLRIVLVLLNLFLILHVVSGDAPRQTPADPNSDIDSDSLTSSLASGSPLDGVTVGVVSSSYDGKELVIPPDTYVSVVDRVVKVDSVSSLKTKSASGSNIEGLTMNTDGSWSARSGDSVRIPKAEASNVRDVSAFPERVSARSGTLMFGGSMFSDVEDLIIVHRGGTPLSVSFVMTKSDVYIVRNPLSSGSIKSALEIVDTDSDGLSDDFEKMNYLDPLKKDSDGDGLTDYDEVAIYPTDATRYNTFTGITGVTNDYQFIQWLSTHRDSAGGDIGKAIISLGLLNGSIARDSDG